MLTAGYRLALVAAHDGPGGIRVVYLFTSGPPDRRVEIQVHLVRDHVQLGAAMDDGRGDRHVRAGVRLAGHTEVGHELE